jgi:hypothetical protein
MAAGSQLVNGVWALLVKVTNKNNKKARILPPW